MTLMSMIKAEASRPSVLHYQRSMTMLKTRALTNEGDDGDFLTVLVLKTCGNPITIATCIGRASDARKHVTRNHDKGGEDGNDSP
jgi:hypothetical protein